jgi:hypothetical protein
MPAPYFGLFAPMKAPDALRPDNKRGPSWWTRLWVRWKRLDLDSALADGANPVTSEEFALRAQQLADSTNRERLAAGLENLFHLATTGPGPGATTAMAVSSFDRCRVAANQAELAALATKLRSAGPHGVRGLAMASVLYEDSGSPLYARTDIDRLKPAVHRAIAALDS